MEPFAFEPQPKITRKAHDLVEIACKCLTWFITAKGMQFEFDPATVVLDQFRAPRKRHGESFQSLVSFAATPMITTKRCQNCVTHGELGFGDVPTNEIRVFAFK